MEQVTTANTEAVVEVTDAGRAAMEAGYTGEKPVEPEGKADAAKVDDKVIEEKTPAAAAPAAAAKADVPVTLESIKSLIKEELRPINGAVGEQGNRLKQFGEQLKTFTPATVAAATAAAKAEGGDAPTKTQVAEALQSSEKMKQLEQDFPEFAAAMKEQAASIEKSVLSKVPKAEKVDTTKFVTADAIATLRQEFIDDAVDQRDPEWETKINSPEFAAWYSKQTPEIQALGQSDKLRDGFKFMDLYAAHEKTLGSVKTTQSQDNKTRLKEAVVPATKGGKIAPKVMTPESAMEMGYKIASGQPV